MDKNTITLPLRITKKGALILVCSILTIASLVASTTVGANTLQDTASDQSVGEVSSEDLTLAQVSPVISYQGRLLRDEAPVDGVEIMTFELYDDQYGGVRCWNEPGVAVNVTNGLFTHALGSIVPLPGQIFDRQLWLQIIVGSVYLPRQKLMAAPYAFSLVPGAQVAGAQSTSVLTVENTATSGTAISAVSSGSGPALKATNNAGGPAIAAYGLGGASKFEVSNNGDITYQGKLVGDFPAPAYDSGWRDINRDEHLYFYHWLGGDENNYLVDLIFYDKADHGINIHGLGAFRRFQEEKGSGAFWRILDNQKIVVKRKKDDDFADQVRVRIWKWDD